MPAGTYPNPGLVPHTGRNPTSRGMAQNCAGGSASPARTGPAHRAWEKGPLGLRQCIPIYTHCSRDLASIVHMAVDTIGENAAVLLLGIQRWARICIPGPSLLHPCVHPRPYRGAVLRFIAPDPRIGLGRIAVALSAAPLHT